MVVMKQRVEDGLWRKFTGLDEAVEQPLLAIQSDHDLAVWAESKRHSWACNTTVLITIRDRLLDEIPPDSVPHPGRAVS